MASGIFYPTAGGDDGYGNSTNFENTNDQIQIGDRWSGAHDNIAFIRFPSITIPAGSTIISAHVVLTCNSSENKTVVIKIYANDVDNAIAPTSGSALMALTKTTEFAAWEPALVWTDGVQYDTSDITDVIQEVISRGGWISGNALQILFVENTSSFGNYKKASSIEYLSGSELPELHVEWSEAPVTSDEVASWNDNDTGSNITFSTDFLTATHA